MPKRVEPNSDRQTARAPVSARGWEWLGLAHLASTAQHRAIRASVGATQAPVSQLSRTRFSSRADVEPALMLDHTRTLSAAVSSFKASAID